LVVVSRCSIISAIPGSSRARNPRSLHQAAIAARPVFMIRQPTFAIPGGMADQRTYTLHEIADFRGEFHAIADKLETVKLQLDQLAQKIPTRRDHARGALGIIFCTAVLTTLAVLWFTGYWHFCL
jgi:hypothetical protein